MSRTSARFNASHDNNNIILRRKRQSIDYRSIITCVCFLWINSRASLTKCESLGDASVNTYTYEFGLTIFNASTTAVIPISSQSPPPLIFTRFSLSKMSVRLNVSVTGPTPIPTKNNIIINYAPVVVLDGRSEKGKCPCRTSHSSFITSTLNDARCYARTAPNEGSPKAASEFTRVNGFYTF